MNNILVQQGSGASDQNVRRAACGWTWLGVVGKLEGQGVCVPGRRGEGLGDQPGSSDCAFQIERIRSGSPYKGVVKDGVNKIHVVRNGAVLPTDCPPRDFGVGGVGGRSEVSDEPPKVS